MPRLQGLDNIFINAISEPLCCRSVWKKATLAGCPAPDALFQTDLQLWVSDACINSVICQNHMATKSVASVVQYSKRPERQSSMLRIGFKRFSDYYRISSQNTDSSWKPMSSSSRDRQHPHLNLLLFSSKSVVVKFINLIEGLHYILYWTNNSWYSLQFFLDSIYWLVFQASISYKENQEALFS